MYAGFRFGGANAVLARPNDKAPMVEGDTWARDRSGSTPGTEIDATWANRLKANLEALVARLNGNLNDGDDQLANAVGNALDGKADLSHHHDDLYYQKSAVDAALSDLQGQINGLGDGRVVADYAAAAELSGLGAGDIVHVEDNGSGKWVRYQVIAAGDGTWSGVTKIVYWTQDQAPASHGHLAADITDSGAAGRSLLQAATAAIATALLEVFVGDSGAGGAKGLVPAPEAGDAAAGKFLGAAGVWLAPPGGVATSRQINTSGLATGGGDLTEDRTIAVPKSSNPQAIAGVDDATAMTPVRTKEAVETFAAFTKFFTSSPQTIMSGGLITLAHGLGAAPRYWAAFLYCQTADMGYSPGDEISLSSQPEGSSTVLVNRGASLYTDATNVYVRIGSESQSFTILHKSTGAAERITNSNWRLIVRAWL